MRLTGPMRQSGKAGLRLRRSDRGHRAFVAGALAALMALSGCDAADFRKGEPAVEEPAVRPYCEKNDCSAFPKGYHSLELEGQWIYIPAPEYLRAAVTDEVLWPMVTGTHGTVEHVLPRLRVSSKSGYRYPNNFEDAVTNVIEREGQVVPDTSRVVLEGCCAGLGAFYKLQALQQVLVPQFRVSGGRSAAIEPFRPGKDVILRVEDAPEEWKGVAARYDLRLPEQADNDPAPKKFSALSKEPLIQGSRVLIECTDPFCMVQWASDQKNPFASGLIVQASIGLCPFGTVDCYTRESIDERFELIDQFLADFDKMLEIMKHRPEEVAR